MESKEIQRLAEETARELRRIEQEGDWPHHDKFPSVAAQTIDWDEKSRRSFMAILARESWPNKYLTFVLWRFITPLKKSGVSKITPISNAPHISEKYAKKILKANSGIASDEELILQGENGFHTNEDLQLKCEEILYSGEEFIGPSSLFEKIWMEFEFRFSDWNINATEGMPRLRRTVTNVVRNAVGRPNLWEGKGIMDPVFDESWKEMLAVKKVGRKVLYRYVGKGRPKPNPVEDAIVAELGEDDDGSGHVYAFVNDAWPGWVKIGMSADWERRLDSYQTYSPHDDYKPLKVVGRISDRHHAEKRAHVLAEKTAAERSGEWFRITDRDAKEVLRRIETETKS